MLCWGICVTLVSLGNTLYMYVRDHEGLSLTDRVINSMDGCIQFVHETQFRRGSTGGVGGTLYVKAKMY